MVVGLPLSLDGTEGPQAARVARGRTATRARSRASRSTYYDERLSSTEARKAMAAAGVSDRDKRGSVDMVAAALFLQSYLDAHRERDRPRDD